MRELLKSNSAIPTNSITAIACRSRESGKVVKSGVPQAGVGWIIQQSLAAFQRSIRPAGSRRVPPAQTGDVAIGLPGDSGDNAGPFREPAEDRRHDESGRQIQAERGIPCPCRDLGGTLGIRAHPLEISSLGAVARHRIPKGTPCILPTSACFWSLISPVSRTVWFPTLAGRGTLPAATGIWMYRFSERESEWRQRVLSPPRTASNAECACPPHSSGSR